MYHMAVGFAATVTFLVSRVDVVDKRIDTVRKMNLLNCACHVPSGFI